MWLNLHFKIVLLGGLEGEASLTVLPEVVAAVVLTKRLDCYTALPKCLSRVPFPTGHRRHNSISTHPPTATSTLLAGVGQDPTRWIPLNYKGPSTAPLRPTRLRPPCFQARQPQPRQSRPTRRKKRRFVDHSPPLPLFFQSQKQNVIFKISVR